MSRAETSHNSLCTGGMSRAEASHNSLCAKGQLAFKRKELPDRTNGLVRGANGAIDIGGGGVRNFGENLAGGRVGDRVQYGGIGCGYLFPPMNRTQAAA